MATGRGSTLPGGEPAIAGEYGMDSGNLRVAVEATIDFHQDKA